MKNKTGIKQTTRVADELSIAYINWIYLLIGFTF